MAFNSHNESLVGSKIMTPDRSNFDIQTFNVNRFRASGDLNVRSRPGTQIKAIRDINTNSSTSEESSSGTIEELLPQNDSAIFRKELHKTILEFIVAFLLENPKDIIDYAVDHFTKIQETRNERLQMMSQSTSSDVNVEATQSERQDNLRNRRASVYAEQVDIEDEVFMDDDDAERLSFIGKTDDQRSRLLRTLNGIFLFQNLEFQQISRVLDVMVPVYVSVGDILLSNEHENGKLYVIEVGDFAIYEHGTVVGTLHNKGTIGEVLLLHKATDVPTVKATTDGMVWAIDRVTFKNILQKHIYKQQKMFDELLKSVKMFEVLNQYERLKLVEALVPKSYRIGEAILKQGDEPDGMYFIEEGDCSVYLDQMKGKGEVIVNRLTKGNYFGELALLTHDKRKASVYAETDVKVAFIDKDSFERLLGKCVNILNRGIEDYNLKDNKMVSYLAMQKRTEEETNAERLSGSEN